MKAVGFIVLRINCEVKNVRAFSIARLHIWISTFQMKKRFLKLVSNLISVYHEIRQAVACDQLSPDMEHCVFLNITKHVTKSLETFRKKQRIHFILTLRNSLLFFLIINNTSVLLNFVILQCTNILKKVVNLIKFRAEGSYFFDYLDSSGLSGTRILIFRIICSAVLTSNFSLKPRKQHTVFFSYSLEIIGCAYPPPPNRVANPERLTE